MSEDSEDTYQVEKIVSKKEIKGVLFYKVKWAGYPASHNTWEPHQNVQHLSLLIE